MKAMKVAARDNPFRTECINALVFRLLPGSWEKILERFAELEYRAAVVGPEGTGKTTFLEQFAPRLAAAGFQPRYIRIRPEEGGRTVRQILSELSRREVLLVDGSETLGLFRWHRFKTQARSAGGLLVSLHKPGRLPTLFETVTTPALLKELAAELAGAEEVLRADAGLESLFTVCGGDIRRALRQCYDSYAECGSLAKLP